MAIKLAPPNPIKNPLESENAWGGKSNTIPISIRNSPDTITHRMLLSTTSMNTKDNRPTDLMSRYSSAVMASTTPTAISFVTSGDNEGAK